jgi:hypothetical protein
MKNIKVLAAVNLDALEDGQIEVESSFDTIAEAKKRAKYYLTTEYQNVCEAATRLTYSQVVVNDIVMYDYVKP